MNLAFCYVYFALLVASVSGYSAGAPEEVCDDMTPKHPVDPQKTDFPFAVSISQKEVKGGEKVQITVAGGKEKTFKGFLIQVRNGDKAVGAFSIPDGDKFAKTINCHGVKQSSATHKNSTDKKTITVDWVAPAKFTGTLNVYTTVAKDGEVFWARQKQSEVKVN